MTGARRWIVPAVLVILTAMAAWLVVTGGDDGSDDPAASGSGETLDITEYDRDEVADFAGLEFPDSTEDFLTARLDDGSQLDVTFTMDPDDDATFVEGSGLPEPVAGDRYITHTSPLWKLNTDSEVRGAEDTVDDIRRQVELVDEDGRTRVRIVITPA